MTDTKQSAQEAVKPNRSPGILLRNARESSGQTHAAVGEALHLTVHYIKALENDDYGKLPGLTFIKGYIRAYARYLKLDVDHVLECYDAHVKVMPAIKSYTLAGNYTRKRNDQAIGWAVVAALIAVTGLGAGWWFVGRDAEPANNALSAAAMANQSANRADTSAPIPPPVTPANTFQPATSSAAPGQGAVLAGPSVGFGVAAPSATGTSPVAQLGAEVTTIVSPTLPTADVVSGATAILPASQDASTNAVIIAGPSPATLSETPNPATALEQSTATATGADAAASAAAAPVDSAATVTASPAGGRQVNLVREGADRLQLNFSGDSWVEIDDGVNSRLYGEMLRAGDVLNVQGSGPFKVLLGNARNVQVNFNASPIDISASIRNDSTARLTLANPLTETTPLEPAIDTPAVAVPAANGVAQ